ncbi:MAG TPA: CBS domain-containing protein [Terriglobales bacterium]|nr:CBS domain-containing protein [Terriglobales bacterium]
MIKNPTCCLSSDSAQHVARLMREHDVTSLPVISDLQSRHLEGMITERELCWGIIAEGKDPKTTAIADYLNHNPVTCKAEDELDHCEKTMQQHQMRSITVVDDEGSCVGSVSQGDLAVFNQFLSRRRA